MNMEKLKWILLGVFLVLEGLMLLGVNIGGNVVSIIAGICAIIAGVLFLIDR
jgi:glucose dehydrogenase